MMMKDSDNKYNEGGNNYTEFQKAVKNQMQVLSYVSGMLK